MKAHLLCALVKLFNGNSRPTRLLELRGSHGSTKNDLDCTLRDRARKGRAYCAPWLKCLVRFAATAPCLVRSQLWTHADHASPLRTSSID